MKNLVVFEKFLNVLTRDGVFTSDYTKEFIQYMKETGFIVFNHTLKLDEISNNYQNEELTNIKLPFNYMWLECSGGILLNFNNGTGKPSAIVGLLIQEENSTYNGYMLSCEVEIVKEKQYLLEDTLKVITFNYDLNNTESMDKLANRILQFCVQNHVNTFNEQKENLQPEKLTFRVSKNKNKLEINNFYKIK